MTDHRLKINVEVDNNIRTLVLDRPFNLQTSHKNGDYYFQYILYFETNYSYDKQRRRSGVLPLKSRGRAILGYKTSVLVLATERVLNLEIDNRS